MISIKSEKIFSLDRILFLLLFLFSINFLNFRAPLFIIMIGIVFCTHLLKKYKIKISLEYIVLIIFSTSYFIFAYLDGEYSFNILLLTWWFPIISYILGYMVLNSTKNVEKGLKSLILIISVGNAFYGILNYITSPSFDFSTGRLIYDFWGNYPLKVTLQNTLFTLITSLLFYILFIEKKLLNKILFLIIIISSIACSIDSASRTLLIITFLVFIANLFLYLYCYRKKISKYLKIIVLISIIVVLAFIFYQNDFLGIQTMYKSSMLYQRSLRQSLSIEGDPRFMYYFLSLEHIFRYPLGGVDFPDFSYAHNMWLDVGGVGGIIPLIFLIIYSIQTIITLIRLIHNSKISIDVKFIIFSVFMALNINFMVEPIIQGTPYLFIFMCLINGTTYKVLNFGSSPEIVLD